MAGPDRATQESGWRAASGPRCSVPKRPLGKLSEHSGPDADETEGNEAKRNKTPTRSLVPAFLPGYTEERA